MREVIVALVVAAAAAGCGECGDDSLGPREDAGRDAGMDAGHDAGARDAGRDASRDASLEPAGWVPLPGLPEGCVIERAEHPEVLFEPLWASCGIGCDYLVPTLAGRGFESSIGWFDGARGWLSVVQGDMRGRHVILAATEGPPIAAWRGPHLSEPGVCAVYPTAIGDGFAAFGIEIAGASLPEQWRLHHAPLDQIGLSTEPLSLVDARIGVQNLAVSSTTVAAELQPSGVVMVFEVGGQRTRGGATSATPGIPQRVQVVGRTVWWEEWAHPISLVTGSLERDGGYFRRNLPDSVLALVVDGTDMAWLQGYGWDGRAFARIELWTAPYTNLITDLRPRRVRNIPTWGQARGGGGVYGFLGGLGVTHLYDLADGRRRTFPSPDGAVVTHDPLYITSDEMLLKGLIDDRPTLFRVQLASLPYE